MLNQQEFTTLREDIQSQFEEFTANPIFVDLLQAAVDASQQKVKELFDERESLQSRLDELKEQQTKDHINATTEIDELKNQIVQLDVTVEEIKVDVDKVIELTTRFESLKDKVPSLEDMIEEHERLGATKEEINEITSDPYKKAFYKTLYTKLNAGYLAAVAIDSGWISNNLKTPIGHFGNFVKEASVIVPLVGTGVGVLGLMLENLDNRQQERIITKYAKITGSVIEMNALAEKVARKIVLAPLEFKDMQANMFDRIKSMFTVRASGNVSSTESATTVVNPAGTGDVFNMAREMQTVADTTGGAAESTVTESQEETSETAAQVKLGKVHATKIAKIIIAGVFSGDFTEKGEWEETAELISKAIIDKFTASVSGQEEEKSDAGDDNAAQAAADQSVSDSSVAAPTPEDIAKYIAESALNRLKMSLNADRLESDTPERERELIQDLIHDLLEKFSDHLIDGNKVKLVQKLATQLKESGIASVNDGKFELSNQFITDEGFVERVINQSIPAPANSAASESQTTSTTHLDYAGNQEYMEQVGPPKNMCCTVSYLTGVEYYNPILNEKGLVPIVAARYGSEVSLHLINLGSSNPAAAKQVIADVHTYGVGCALNMVFGYSLEESDLTNLSSIEEDAVFSLLGSAPV